MLLIDPRRTIASIPPHASLVPFIRTDFGGDTLKIAGFLAGAAPLELLIPLLLKELASTGHPPKLNVSLPMLILTEAARAIAQGSIRLGLALPETVTVIFRPAAALENHYEDAVRFANPWAATDFLRRWLKDPAWAKAFAETLTHPRAAEKQAPAGDETIPWFANLFLRHKLALFPIGSDRGRLRIAWINHQAITKADIAAAPPPPAASPVAQIVQAIASTLPDLPPEISPQAQTLIDAAESGVPFCEECAKEAAGLVGV